MTKPALSEVEGAFIDAHREELGIEPICRELAVAPPRIISMPRALPTRAGVPLAPGGTTS